VYNGVPGALYVGAELLFRRRGCPIKRCVAVAHRGRYVSDRPPLRLALVGGPMLAREVYTRYALYKADG
jgi:hypothetical protein